MAASGTRVIVVKVGHVDGDDDGIVADALAEAGITRLPNDLLVRVLNFSADHLRPAGIRRGRARAGSRTMNAALVRRVAQLEQKQAPEAAGGTCSGTGTTASPRPVAEPGEVLTIYSWMASDEPPRPIAALKP